MPLLFTNFFTIISEEINTPTPIFRKGENEMTREEDIKNAVETLRKGGVILYPTDTVWGIGCDATNEEAVRRIYEIKHRDDSKAMICLVDNPNRIQKYSRSGMGPF